MDLLKQLKIDVPIFLSPMAGVSTPKLAAEVSNSGGLGSLGLGASSIEEAKAMIETTKTLTKRSFQVNFFCHTPETLDPYIEKAWIEYLTPEFKKFNETPPQTLQKPYQSFLENDDYLNLVLETKPQAISFHFGIPHSYQLKALKDAGIITMASATNLSEAKCIENAGIDIIIAQGIEAGGHRGLFNPRYESGISTYDLIKHLVPHCQIPIVAAGGIMDGYQAQFFLDLGAQAVQLGTAFIQCESSNASDTYRQTLLTKPLTQITATISGRPARGIINEWHKIIDTPNKPTIASYPFAYDIGKQLNAAAMKEANHEYSAFWAGINVAQIRQMSAPKLMTQLIREMGIKSL